MKLRFAAAALPLAAWGALVLGGCNTANEESLGGQTSKAVPNKGDTPNFQSYGEMSAYQTEQAAKKKSGGKAKPAPAKSPPKAESVQSGTDAAKPKS
jgi:hypothetical protein